MTLEAVRASIKHQRIWEESHPPVHRVLGIQTVLWAADCKVAHESVHFLLAEVQEPLENIVFDSPPLLSKLLEKSKSPVGEVLAHHWRKK